MAEAVLRYGDPVMVKHTAAAAIVAGEVVLVGNLTGWTCGIAHDAIANTVDGTLAAGGGVYDVVNLNNSANGAKIYWDTAVNKVTSVSTNMALFGFIVSGGAGGANTTCQALHKPYV